MCLMPVWLGWRTGTGHVESQKQCHQVEADIVWTHAKATKATEPQTGMFIMIE